MLQTNFFLRGFTTRSTRWFSKSMFLATPIGVVASGTVLTTSFSTFNSSPTTRTLLVSPSNSVLVGTVRFNSEGPTAIPSTLSNTESADQQQSRPTTAGSKQVNHSSEMYLKLQQVALAAIGEDYYNLLAASIAAIAVKKENTAISAHNNNTESILLGKWIYDWFKQNQKSISTDEKLAEQALKMNVLESIVKSKTCDAETAFALSRTACPKLLDAIRNLMKQFEVHAVQPIRALIRERIELILAGDARARKLFGTGGILQKHGVTALSTGQQMVKTARRWRAPTAFLHDKADFIRRHVADGGKKGVAHLSTGDRICSALLSAKDRVHIITGPSGGGKTCTALLMSASLDPNSVELCAVTLYLEAKDMPFQNKILLYEESKDKRNFFTTVGVLCAVYHLLFNVNLGEEFSKQYPAAMSWTDEGVGEFFEDKFSGRFLPEKHARVVIVVDEIGSFPHLLFGLTSAWKGLIQSSLEKFLNLSAGVHLVVAGTGSDNFELVKCNSQPETYAVYSMLDSSVIFSELLDHVCQNSACLQLQLPRLQIADSMIGNDAKGEYSQNNDDLLILHGFLSTFAATFRTELFQYADASESNKKTAPRRRRIDDEVSHRFHQLVCNPRCAAIAIQCIIRLSVETTDYSKSSVIVRVLLPVICSIVAAEFQAMNALAGKTPDEVLSLLKVAITIVMDRRESVKKNEWESLGTRCGLISDSSKFVEKTEKVIHWKDVPVDPASFLGPEGFKLIYDARFPRFRITASAISMFLTKVNPLGADSILHSSSRGDSFVFEHLVADFITTSAILPKKEETSNNDKKPTSTSLFRTPRQIFDFREAWLKKKDGGSATQISVDPQVHRCRQPLPFRFDGKLHKNRESQLEKKKIENEKPLSPLETWKKEVAEKVKANHVAIYMNGDSAAAADVLAVAPNTAFSVQAKYAHEKNKPFEWKDVEKMFGKMEDPLLLLNLAESCRVENNPVVTLHSVCLVVYAKNYPPELFAEDVVGRDLTDVEKAQVKVKNEWGQILHERELGKKEIKSELKKSEDAEIEAQLEREAKNPKNKVKEKFKVSNSNNGRYSNHNSNNKKRNLEESAEIKKIKDDFSEKRNVVEELLKKLGDFKIRVNRHIAYAIDDPSAPIDNDDEVFGNFYPVMQLPIHKNKKIQQHKFEYTESKRGLAGKK